jgi:hypothetical protein
VQAIPFFNGAASLGNSWFWLQFLPSAGCHNGNSNYFGYYSFTAAPWIDHLDMGWAIRPGFRRFTTRL